MLGGEQKPVFEEPCVVREVAPDADIISGCSCHNKGHDYQQEVGSKGVHEKCEMKNTYYSRLNSQYNQRPTAPPTHQPQATKTFSNLRQECLYKGQLFVDNGFPANSYSIAFDGETYRDYVWKRPHEIVSDPHFFVEGATRFDIQQGELGDCWLLAAISTLTLNPNLFYFVVPYDQGFTYMYSGIFHFRFWQYGRWMEVVVDDLLPTYNGRLVYMHSKTCNEFWCAILEKAYAKLYGCYEALRGGNISESMVDLTGGVVETIQLQKPQPHLFAIMRKAYRRGALMGCSIEPRDPRIPVEGRLTNGLIMRHAYSVTRVTNINYRQSEEELVRLHNPWGNEAEWKGSWSDQSPEWHSISDNERERLGITFDDDGEFWMPFKEFLLNFTSLEICDVTPDIFAGKTSSEENPLREEDSQGKWRMRLLEGAWVRGKSAGGCRNFLDTFAQNPQFPVLLDSSKDKPECTLMVSLMQKNVRQRKRFGADYLPIGFALYKLPPGIPPGEKLSTDFFKYNNSSAKSPYFLNTREVAHHFRFPPGVYAVVPSTFEPHQEGEFLLRVFTDRS